MITFFLAEILKILEEEEEEMLTSPIPTIAEQDSGSNVNIILNAPDNI
jgi:hypothetical protein